MIGERHYFLILCLFLLIPSASAVVTDFQVQVDTQPAYFEITYSPAGTVIWYALNSSVNYGDTTWTLYGTNDDLYFTLLNTTQHYVFVADTVYTMPLTCSGSYTKYYLELTDGFTTPAANLNITLNTSAGSTGIPTTIKNVKKRPYQSDLDWVVIAFCTVVLGGGGFMILTYPKK